MEQWLKSVGLGHWVAAFCEQGITRDQLTTLTETDLRELGLNIGERKRFVAALDAEGPRHSKSPFEAGEPDSKAAGEWRPLTIMCVDLVDSTSLGEQLQTEDLIEVIRRYRELCAAAIKRFGGQIMRLVGDGTLAYFSYPVANENDPERAARAALAIVRGIGGLKTPAAGPLQVRIGLATGRVIVSDVFAGGTTDQHAVLGSAPNLAARLQTLSPPNGIVVSESTHAHLRARFACESLGKVKLKGFEELHEPWVLLDELPRRGAAERRQPLTAFHGRASELSILRLLWSDAVRGEGKVALIVGEAGMGKSRLVEQLTEAQLSTDACTVRLAASAFDEDAPLRPFIDHIRAIAGLTGVEAADEALAKIDAVVLGQGGAREHAKAILAGLLGVPVDDVVIAKLRPEQLKAQTIAVLVEQLLLPAEMRPVCLVVEDLHWLDPTSREVLDNLIQRVPVQRILMLLTVRPDTATEWATRADATLRLGRLGPAEVTAMLGGVFNDRQVPPHLLREVISRTDGVPLFVEEMARLLLSREVGRAAGARASDVSSADDSQIPPSLDESLMARLDRSGIAKTIAQAAAVAGRSVRRDVLAAVCSVAAEALSEPLAALVASGVLDPAAEASDDSYRFHHALLRDAAYGSILRDRRRDLHARVAEALRDLDPDTVKLRPEILAMHLTEAGLAEDAASHWLEAARRSLSQSAQMEATRMLQRGLTALARQPDTSRNLSLRLQLSALLGPALIGLRGPLASETQELYATALKLCEVVPEEPSHFPILFGWWRLSPDFHTHLARSDSLLERATQRKDPDLLLQAHHCSWASHFNTGRFARCCDHIDAGLAIYHSGDYAHHARLYGNHDAKACAHGVLSQLRWMQGNVKAALDEEARALAWADKSNHLGSRMHALDLTLLHRVYRRDLQEVYHGAGRLLSFAREHGLADHGAAGLVFQGWVVATQQDPAAGIQMLEEGFARQREIVTAEDFPVYLCLLAEALTAAGRADEAVERIEKERPEFERIGLAVWMPELLRVLGDTVLAADSNAIEQAHALYAEATAMAAAQGVPMLALRVAMSKARLDLRTGVSAATAMQLGAALGALAEQDEAYDFVVARELVATIDGCVEATRRRGATGPR